MNKQTATYTTSEDIWNTAVYGFWYVVLQCMVLLYGVCMVYGYSRPGRINFEYGHGGSRYHLSRVTICFVSGVWCLVSGVSSRDAQYVAFLPISVFCSLCKAMTSNRNAWVRLLLILSWHQRSLGLHSIVFPLTRKYTPDHGVSLLESFHKVVDSTDFFVASSTQPGRCSVPLFGDDVTVTFAPASRVPITEYVLRVQGSTLTQSDVAWILLKFFECKESFEPLSRTTALRKAVAEHYNAQPPHPGYNAELTACNGNRLAMLDSNALALLKKDGFVVVDMDLKTSNASNQKLSEFLVQSTGQGPSVRRDTVAFLDKNDALACGLEQQYDFLMSIAAHLNHHFSFPSSPFQPLAPGTHSRPLTNPKHIQAAEYGMDGFYVAHRYVTQFVSVCVCVCVLNGVADIVTLSKPRLAKGQMRTMV